MRSYNPRVIGFHDPCFGHLKSWRREFLSGLAEAKVDVPMWAETRVDFTDAEDLDLFERCGFYLFFGVETMSPRMAEIMRKAPDGEKYVRAADETLREVNRRQMLSKALLLMNHPGDTAESAEQTVGYFERFVAEHDKVTVLVDVKKYRHLAGNDIDVRRTYYERTYGTRFVHPDWYREPAPNLDLADASIVNPGFEDVDEYERRIDDLNPQILRKMPAARQLDFLQHAHLLK